MATEPQRRLAPAGAAVALALAGSVVFVLLAFDRPGVTPPDGPSGSAAAPTTSGGPTTNPAPSATRPPVAEPGSTVRVSSIPALLNALADNAVTEIVVANGTYRVSPAILQASDSLWIGSRFAHRTRAVTVRAETRGGVTFDGGGASSFGGLSFEQGAHSQTWDGFNFANGRPTATGVVTFGGAGGAAYEAAGPHHITLRHITIEASCSGRSPSASSEAQDHAIYVSQGLGTGPHDLLFEDITVDGTGFLASAFHFYNADDRHPNAENVTVRRLRVVGTQQAIILWAPLRNIVFDGATITGALKAGVRYEAQGSGIVFRDVITTGSGQLGWYSSQGSSPPGVTLSGSSFR